MFGKILAGLVLMIFAFSASGGAAQDMFKPLGHQRTEKPSRQLGTIIAPNGIAIKLTENDQGSLDRTAPFIESQMSASRVRSQFLVRRLKTSERLYIVIVVNGIEQGRERPFNRAIPRDKDGGYSHGDEAQLLRHDLYELCESGSSCTYVEELYAVFTPAAFERYYAEDGLVLKMVSDDANFDIVRIPRDHIEAAIAVAAQD